MKIILIAFAIYIVISMSVFVFANNAMAATTTHVNGNSKPAVTKDDSHTKTTKPHESYCKESPTTQCMNYHHPPPHKPQHPPGGPCEARINCPPPECKKGEFINPITHKCVPKVHV